MNLDDAIKILQADGIKIPYQARNKIQDMQYVKEGTEQVWVCVKCPGFMYKAPLECLEVWCKNDHKCQIMWSRATSSLK